MASREGGIATVSSLRVVTFLDLPSFCKQTTSAYPPSAASNLQFRVSNLLHLNDLFIA